jgi:hypothetical protein
VLNILGKTVYRTALDKPTIEIDLSRFPKGSYILKTDSKTGNSSYRKVLVY